MRFETREEAHSYLRKLGTPKHRISKKAVVIHTKHGKRLHVMPYAVIGEEGFGFDPESEFNNRWRHIGKVILGDDVEVGSGTSIERGVLTNTIIGNKVKIDMNCLIGHNTIIGNSVLIAGGTTIGGSVEIGSNVFIGLGVTIKDHIKIGNNVLVGAGSVVVKNVPDYKVVSGNPAHRQERQMRIPTDTNILPLKRFVYG